MHCECVTEAQFVDRPQVGLQEGSNALSYAVEAVA
jgi:hypothetical protein